MVVKYQLNDNYHKEAESRNTINNKRALLPVAYLAGARRLREMIQHVPCAVQERRQAWRVEVLAGQVGAGGINRLPLETTCTQIVAADYLPNVGSRLTTEERSAIASASELDDAVLKGLLYRDVLLPLDKAIREGKELVLDDPIAEVVADLKTTIDQQRTATGTAASDGVNKNLIDSAALLDQVAQSTDEMSVALLSDDPAVNMGTAAGGSPDLLDIADWVESLSAASLQRLNNADDNFLTMRQVNLVDALVQVETAMDAAYRADPETAILLAKRTELEGQAEAAKEDLRRAAAGVDFTQPG